jgi:hypothetical protein
LICGPSAVAAPRSPDPQMRRTSAAPSESVGGERQTFCVPGNHLRLDHSRPKLKNGFHCTTSIKAVFSLRKRNYELPDNASRRAGAPNQALPGKLAQFTKICKSPRLTVMFSGIIIYVSSSIPIRPYP